MERSKNLLRVPGAENSKKNPDFKTWKPVARIALIMAAVVYGGSNMEVNADQRGPSSNTSDPITTDISLRKKTSENEWVELKQNLNKGEKASILTPFETNLSNTISSSAQGTLLEDSNPFDSNPFGNKNGAVFPRSKENYFNNPFGPSGPEIGIPSRSESEEPQDPFQAETQIVINTAQNDLLLAQRFLFIKHLDGISNEQFIEDVKIYYPIYKKVADRYGFHWTLLWVVHETETKASRDLNVGCNGKCVNGFQRHIGWGQEIVDKAAEGLEGLKDFPQRDQNDWREAAFAAWHLVNVPSKPHSPEEGLYSYGGFARERLKIYYSLREVFD